MNVTDPIAEELRSRGAHRVETIDKDGVGSLVKLAAKAGGLVQDVIEQALELWGRLARPNVMIKVPATEAGIPAIEELTARGVNVNITLLFSLARYEQVIDAYVAGQLIEREQLFSKRGIDSAATLVPGVPMRRTAPLAARSRSRVRPG